MVFSSAVFVFAFLPITFLVYYLIREKYRNTWLLLCSVFFYSWGEPKYVFLLLISTVVNYVFGLLINEREGVSRKLALTLITVFNLGILVYFKYSVFFAGILNSLTGIDLSGTFLVSHSPMPIGISFFTFQILSYQIDLYRKEVGVQRSAAKLALYIFLFPQMIAGPIVRYSDVEREIENREVDLALVYAGIRRFMIGFSKKVLLANTMAAAADYAYAHIGVSAALSWLGSICYTLQIYYDFSGYSDMAIGMGKMAGFRFEENFKFPYRSASIQEFWRKWHISLSSWFRDYLYIPLGGNRRGVGRTYLNLGIIWLVTGLWHGASFNFIVWGLFHGLFSIGERLIGRNRLEKIPRIFMRIYTLLVVNIGWIFFRADTLRDAVKVIRTMFTFSAWNIAAVYRVLTPETSFFLILSLLLAGGIPPVLQKLNGKLPAVSDILLFFVYFVAILYMIGSGFNPFIYFRF